MKISEQIQKLAEQRGAQSVALEAMQKKQEELANKAAELSVDDASDDDMTVFDDLKKANDDLEQAKSLEARLTRQIEALKETEQKRASEAAPVAGKAPAFISEKARKFKPLDGLIRLGVVKALSHVRHMPEVSVMDEIYGDDDHTKAMIRFMTKTASPIATTTDTDYASNLVVEGVRGLLVEAEAVSVAAALSLWAERLGGYLIDFGGDNSIKIPRLTPTGASPTEPAWVQEGGAIPVGSLQIGSMTLNRYKLAEILVSTMELKERSITDIEALFRRAITAAYAKVLDNAVLSVSAAVSGVRPAGLLNGITVAAGDATGGMDSVRADVMAMEGELLAVNQAAAPVLLLNNRNRRGLSFVTSALGDFIFADELATGRLFEIPVVSSANVPFNTAYMVDASSLAMALDAPMFDVSQIATVVMADADGVAPTMADDGSGAAGTAGQVQDGIGVVPSAATVAGAGAGYTARSMFQTYSEAVRMIAPTSFALMRAGTVAGRNTLAWAS